MQKVFRAIAEVVVALAFLVTGWAVFHWSNWFETGKVVFWFLNLVIWGLGYMMLKDKGWENTLPFAKKATVLFLAALVISGSLSTLMICETWSGDTVYPIDSKGRSEAPVRFGIFSPTKRFLVTREYRYRQCLILYKGQSVGTVVLSANLKVETGTDLSSASWWAVWGHGGVENSAQEEFERVISEALIESKIRIAKVPYSDHAPLNDFDQGPRYLMKDVTQDQAYSFARIITEKLNAQLPEGMSVVVGFPTIAPHHATIDP